MTPAKSKESLTAMVASQIGRDRELDHIGSWLTEIDNLRQAG
jgi:hypothetical protein